MLNELPPERVTSALRFLAVEAKLSQEKLAAKVGMSQSAMSRRLSDLTPANLDEIATIAEALGYEVRITFAPKQEAAA